jgi:hypothetical protein
VGIRSGKPGAKKKRKLSKPPSDNIALTLEVQLTYLHDIVKDKGI